MKGEIITLILISLVLASGISGCVENGKKSIPHLNSTEAGPGVANSGVVAMYPWMRSNDSSVCADPQYNQSSYECYAYFALKEKDYLICDRLQEPLRDRCYGDYASAAKDPEVCASITDAHFKDGCQYAIAVNENESSGCDLINDVGSKIACYNSIASASGNISLCNRIKQVSDQCQSENAALAKGENPVNCGTVYSPPEELCFSTIARIKKDQAICDFITDRQLKISCICDLSDTQEKVKECFTRYSAA